MHLISTCILNINSCSDWSFIIIIDQYFNFHEEMNILFNEPLQGGVTQRSVFLTKLMRMAGEIGLRLH